MASDRVMANYVIGKETRVYVDDAPDGLGATLAQKHEAEGYDHEVWRQVWYSSRPKTPAEKEYSKVGGKSLGI